MFSEMIGFRFNTAYCFQMMITGDQLRYVTLRKMVGTQAHAASLLGVGIRTVQRRESGEIPITKEAGLAIRMLGEDPFHKKHLRPVDERKDQRHRSRHVFDAVVREFIESHLDPAIQRAVVEADPGTRAEVFRLIARRLQTAL
jgi:hypothetical protein